MPYFFEIFVPDAIMASSRNEFSLSFLICLSPLFPSRKSLASLSSSSSSSSLSTSRSFRVRPAFFDLHRTLVCWRDKFNNPCWKGTALVRHTAESATPAPRCMDCLEKCRQFPLAPKSTVSDALNIRRKLKKFRTIRFLWRLFIFLTWIFLVIEFKNKSTSLFNHMWQVCFESWQLIRRLIDGARWHSSES